ncbi:MAG: TonB-dependent receptor, partial [Betaproteobacteria bacterium]|nr:TonB-dependent receptor [Betaproteobacteria bacterium]
YSPKAALSFQATPQWVLKASSGRAVRMPTVSELYGSTTAAAAASGQTFMNEPLLKPERSKTTELTAEKDTGTGLLRITLFTETVRDSIFSQVKVDSLNTSATTKRVTNVGRMRTDGVEIYALDTDAWLKGLDVSGSLTYANSRIKENAGFDYSSNTSTAFNTINQYQPRACWRWQPMPTALPSVSCLFAIPTQSLLWPVRPTAPCISRASKTPEKRRINWCRPKPQWQMLWKSMK